VLREIAARSLHRHRLIDGFVLARSGALEDPDYRAIYDLGFTIHRETRDANMAGMEIEIALTLSGRNFLQAQGIAPEDAKSANSCVTPWLRTDEGDSVDEGQSSGDASTPYGGHFEPDEADTSRDEQDLGGPAPPATAQPAPPSPAADTFDLPPMLAIVAVEAAHKIAAHGVEKGQDAWIVPVRDRYYLDNARVQKGVQIAAWKFIPYNRDVTGLVLSRRCLDWLAATYDLTPTGDGRLVVGDAELARLHAQLDVRPIDDGPYATSWLNPISPAAAAALAPAAPTAPPAAASPSPAPASFSDHLRGLGAEARSRVVERLCAALKEARIAIATGGARRLRIEEVAKLRALIDSALEAAGADPADA
jgi:hypothetical protein